jgi:hypothetical protein
MIGTTIDARPPYPKGAVSFLIVATALIGLGLAMANVHLLIAAAMPLVLAFCLWQGQPAHVVLIVEHDGLRVFGNHEKIHFDDIVDVVVGGISQRTNPSRPPQQAIEVHHAQGCLVVPHRMSSAPAEFCRFLVAKLEPHPTREAPAALAAYASEQITKFGPQKVHVIHARRHIAEIWRKRRTRWVWTGIFLGAVSWMAAGVAGTFARPEQDDFAAWVGFGAIIAIVSGLAYLVTRLGAAKNSQRQLHRHPNACIVIGPTGLAMSQGELQGAMPWHEVKKASSSVSQFFRTSRMNGVQIQIRGGEIVAFDIYERTPGELAQLIRSNLNSPQ